MTLVALNIAQSATPMSAKTASHMVAMPMIPSAMKKPLTAKDAMMFCQTIRFVFRAI
jgi:hypothetical protein